MSSTTVNDSHHFQDDPARKRRLKEHLDGFISREKALLSDDESEMELQYRLDNFMHRLQARMEAFTREPLPSDVSSDDSSEKLERWDERSVVEELLPASELLYLEESFGEERAAEVVRTIEEEFGVYKIRELNVNMGENQSSHAYRLRQGLIAVAVASLLLWAVWPAEEVAPIVETVVVEKGMELESAAGEPEAEAGESVTVMSYFGNVRSRPSSKGEVLFQIKKGDVVTKLDTKWGWYQIRLDDGREGWAYQGLFIAPETQQPTVGESNNTAE